MSFCLQKFLCLRITAAKLRKKVDTAKLFRSFSWLIRKMSVPLHPDLRLDSKLDKNRSISKKTTTMANNSILGSVLEKLGGGDIAKTIESITGGNLPDLEKIAGDLPEILKKGIAILTSGRVSFQSDDDKQDMQQFVDAIQNFLPLLKKD